VSTYDISASVARQSHIRGTTHASMRRISMLLMRNAENLVEKMMSVMSITWYMSRCASRHVHGLMSGIDAQYVTVFHGDQRSSCKGTKSEIHC
jgi:hypothetical protein